MMTQERISVRFSCFFFFMVVWMVNNSWAMAKSTLRFCWTPQKSTRAGTAKSFEELSYGDYVLTVGAVKDRGTVIALAKSLTASVMPIPAGYLAHLRGIMIGSHQGPKSTIRRGVMIKLV